MFPIPKLVLNEFVAKNVHQLSLSVVSSQFCWDEELLCITKGFLFTRHDLWRPSGFTCDVLNMEPDDLTFHLNKAGHTDSSTRERGSTSPRATAILVARNLSTSSTV